MRLLLDTHIFLWAIRDDRRLSKMTRSKLQNADEVYVSSASIWELMIKIKLKKLDADPKQLVNAIIASGFIELPVTARHAITTAELPDIHRDPFDRILVAQAICEPLTLITADANLEEYSDLVELVV